MNWKRVEAFYRRYISSGFGWYLHVTPEILTAKNTGKQIAKDVVSNVPNFFKRHKTYVRRENYHLTILPPKGILAWFAFPFYFIPALIHELTHALAIQYSKKYFTISLLPMLTEVPFFFVLFLNVNWVIRIFCAFIGMTGLFSLPDLFEWLRINKEELKEWGKIILQ